MSAATCTRCASCAQLPAATLITPDSAELLRLGLRVASRYAIAALEEVPDRLQIDGLEWFDTRPMLDEREHSLELIEMGRELVRYLLSAGLAAQHPQHPHALRVRMSAESLADL